MGLISKARLAAGVLTAGVILGGYRWEWLSYLAPSHRQSGDIVGLSRQPLRKHLDPMPTDLAVALAEAHRRMVFGETIALVYAPPAQAYSWAWFRSIYELAPRRVLLHAGIADPRLGRSLRKADYVLTWNQPLEVPNSEVILTSGDAVLIKVRK